MRVAREAAVAAVAGVVLLWSAASVLAACSDDIASLETKLEALGRQAGAASSSGQADAAARGGKAEEARKTDTPVSALAKPPTPENEKATQSAAAAGGGGGVMTAKATLNDAKIADGKHDEAGCSAAVAKARSEAGL